VTDYPNPRYHFLRANFSHRRSEPSVLARMAELPVSIDLTGDDSPVPARIRAGRSRDEPFLIESDEELEPSTNHVRRGSETILNGTDQKVRNH
jgi:hypothetical protein